MNDPCGPCYNPKTGEYNVFFQWNPSGNNWGNISWGKAVSKDLVSWEIDGWPVLTPTEPYDCKGIFTGCVVPTGDTLTCFYTSVSHLPISHEMNYTRGSETLSVADGKTFQRHEGNPILPGPPDGLDVTGWRDPYVAQWPALDRLRGKSEGSNLYGVISGGIRSKTPTAFLYAINPEKLQEWTFLSILTNVGINSHPTHLRWSGALGKNWEVLNFVSLTDKADGTELQVLIMSVEGCDQPGHHGRRAQLWLSGELLNTVDGPQLTPSFWGRLDHGCLYAANGFWDPVAKKQLIYGWITEDDLADDNRKRQGWSGCLSFPRVASLVTLRGVMSGWVSPLDQMTHIKAEKETGGRGYIVRTLGSFPDMRVATGLRSKATKKTISSVSDSIELSSGHAWEVNIDACLEDNCGNVGIKIGTHSLRYPYPSRAKANSCFRKYRTPFLPHHGNLHNHPPPRLRRRNQHATGNGATYAVQDGGWDDGKLADSGVEGSECAGGVCESEDGDYDESL